MPTVQNPVLKGFAPDPSILRVGDDYYIATSTFEWFPGVQIMHSRDLVNWRVACFPLTRYSQLDMRGCVNSGGIWAPCLTYDKGLYYLIYTNVRQWSGHYKDVSNYLVTAPSIDGPWSEPTYLNGSGFDPSLFHDDDGRKWLVNMLWDHRPGKNAFGGILLQEFDTDKKALVGPITSIFKGSDLGLVEGPHVYKINGWYYLITAEGGTFHNHAVTVARSRSLHGPYEVMPDNPLVTSAKNPLLRLNSSGHGSLVQNKEGSWLLAHLCRRPFENGRSMLGRETALQSITWIDGWPRLTSGGQEPSNTVEVPNLLAHRWPAIPVRDDFDQSSLAKHWQSLRVPMDENVMSLSARKGHLRLVGRQCIASLFEQSLIARRQQSFVVEASTCVEFSPDNFQQMAGLVAFYSTDSFYYLFLTSAAHSKRCLGLMKCEKGVVSYPVEKEYPVDHWDKVYLKLSIDHERIRFHYSADGEHWSIVGVDQDASILSDEHALPFGFTGNFVGVACQDLSGTRKHADFDWFDYRELDKSELKK